MFGAIADLLKHGHDESVGRGLDMWQTNYMDRKIQNRTAELNREFWTYQMSNAYKLTMDDMRKAGLNPLLAMGNGATNVGGHASSASGYNGSKQSNWLPSQSLLAVKQMKNLDSVTDKNLAESKLTEANATSAKTQAEINQKLLDIYKKHPKMFLAMALKNISPQGLWQMLTMTPGMAFSNKLDGPHFEGDK